MALPMIPAPSTATRVTIGDCMLWVQTVSPARFPGNHRKNVHCPGRVGRAGDV
jgi:hypothetical protein